MELKDTIEMMNGKDYKERFKAEYYQTKIRYEKLKKFNTKLHAAEITQCQKNRYEGPQADCPLYLLQEQQKVMAEYLSLLELRAVIENIKLD